MFRSSIRRNRASRETGRRFMEPASPAMLALGSRSGRGICQDRHLMRDIGIIDAGVRSRRSDPRWEVAYLERLIP